MKTTQSYENWRLQTDEDNILWVIFDKKDASANTIDAAVITELSHILNALMVDTMHKGVVLTSGKKSGFVAGADISQFAKFKNTAEAIDILTYGQNILFQLESLKMPTVAMISGFCLGGGLELALACRYRVAEDNTKTRLGLPEVKLGIHPGWGGTVRLPRIIGCFQGLSLALSGRTLSAKAAAKLGVVDAAVPKRQLVRAAKYYILHAPEKRQMNALQAFCDKKIPRQIIAHVMRKKLAKKVSRLHYPAPFYVLDNWERVGVETKEAYTLEARSCGNLFFSETSRNLVRIFFLQERLKGLAKQVDFAVHHVHVVGAGTMGGDIASWCALRGFTVTLQDLKPEVIAQAIKRAYSLFKEILKEDYLVQQAMDRLIPDVSGLGVGKADVVIEAAVENIAVKRAIFKDLELRAKPTAVLASNTSSIPLDEIGADLQQPNRIVGIHFFNPVSKMLLVEIVSDQRTNKTVVEQATSFVRQIDRLPLPVKSSPGFLVNRILMPYLLESVALLKEGIPMTAIDKAMLDFGMPMGPITLADKVGLDVCLSVAQNLNQYYHRAIPQQLIDVVQQGHLGCKTGQGFYQYDKRGKQIKGDIVPYDKPLEDIAKRLVSCMLDESFACLQEGVVADADLIDAGMVFGTGFAPFRGGPMHYAQTLDVLPTLKENALLV
ncbi:MAG TPA: 3-hydroxyacyl-CoA dehydrogenase NAD-binding domain-containing protein [Gammaproteobacteria bacterium]|jgi:3-hydroxyacyl-CoA dehydrogenase/enoyl-CoA hydratase/3-hydroxybutyryl-CoA epimerase|nr:3-hydroxyacyl-CoA dehydrogenase NAD-binding domain-containing protein [Gammaproteobacteria bacterium]